MAGPIGDSRQNGHNENYPHGHRFVDVGIRVAGKCDRERPTASIINNSTNANRLLFKPTHVTRNGGFYSVGGNSCYHNATFALCPLGGGRWPLQWRNCPVPAVGNCSMRGVVTCGIQKADQRQIRNQLTNIDLGCNSMEFDNSGRMRDSVGTSTESPSWRHWTRQRFSGN